MEKHNGLSCFRANLTRPESYWAVPRPLIQLVGGHGPARRVGRAMPARLTSIRAESCLGCARPDGPIWPSIPTELRFEQVSHVESVPLLQINALDRFSAVE